MSLAETRVNEACRIESASLSEADRKYESAGIRAGKGVRVLCRYPANDPRYLEVQLECGGLVTIPVALAHEVHVRPL